jgi:Xaa-Pro aminopeptidase
MEARQKQDIRRRQRRLLKALGDDLFIQFSGVDYPRNRNQSFPFRQDSNFAYLSGFPERDAVLVIDASQERERVTLFAKTKIRNEEVWQGFTIGIKAAGEQFPVDKVYPISQLETVLKRRLSDRQVHVDMVKMHPRHDLVARLITDGAAAIVTESVVLDELAAMRVIKSPWEIEQIKQAVKVTAAAQIACMRAVSRCRYEYELQAEYEYTCMRAGAQHQGFQPIVASGPRTTCQHYVENSEAFGKGDLVLLDTGAEWNLYSADLTRTFPVSGKFSARQRDAYGVVLAAQKAAIAAADTTQTLADLHQVAARRYVEGLKALRLLHGSVDEILEKKAYTDFWPASLGHPIGLSTHDVQPQGVSTGGVVNKKLRPGMVFTVEPGFYTQDFNHQVPEVFRQIGVRIEDDILVTKSGMVNLSESVPKEVEAVEAMVQGG